MQENIDLDMEGMPSDSEIWELRRALSLDKMNDVDVDKAWSRFSSLMEHQEKKHSSVRIWKILGLTASVAAILVAACLLVPIWTSNKQAGVQVFAATDTPKHILVTTEEGEEKITKGGTLDFAQKTSPRRVFHVQTMEVATPRGQVCHVVLPDGTRVQLNGDSKMTFPKVFVGEKREITLSGEAYFEVKKDVHRPFTITTESLCTTVHGTTFDLCAYPGRESKVTLVEGSVSVKDNHGESVMIKPGQMACLNSEGRLNVHDVDTYPLTQWKDGFFYFDDEQMVNILMELGRWYNVNIVFENEKLMSQHLHFVAERKDPLRSVIARINDLSSAHIQLNGDVITVK